MNKEHQKFTPNYEELKQIAEQLRVQKEINIDELIPMIERATKAYNICKERLEAVKVALEQYMPPSSEEQIVN